MSSSPNSPPVKLPVSQIDASQSANSTKQTSKLPTPPMSMDHSNVTSEVSDNRINTPSISTETSPLSSESDGVPPPKDETISLQLVLSELRDIKQQMSEFKGIKQQISKIESATGSVDEKLTGVMNRTSELETAVVSNSARLREYDDHIVSINAALDKHEKSISSLKSDKEDFSAAKTKAVSDMNRLISIQKEQVDSFNTNTKKLSKNILMEVDQKLSTISKNQEASRLENNKAISEEIVAHLKQQNPDTPGINATSLLEASEEITKNILTEIDQKLAKSARKADFKLLTDQAFNNRNNLIVVGLPEDSNRDTSTVLKDFLNNKLNLKNVRFDNAQRIGSSPVDPSGSYARPIMVHFPLLPHRNRVWMKRLSFTDVPDGQRVTIHADLPKQLRDDIQALYKVAKAVNSSTNNHSARVHDYTLEFDDQVFLPSELEMLPLEFRPSTLAAPRSDSALAFFSKYTILSNHHPSIFCVDNCKFHSMEQFLAFRRAQISSQPSMVQKASHATDPVQAKYILSSLREDNVQQWDETVEAVAMEGLEAKFRQNDHMRSFLCSTLGLTLGEASTNKRWGVGMAIDDKKILDVSNGMNQETCWAAV